MRKLLRFSLLISLVIFLNSCATVRNLPMQQMPQVGKPICSIIGFRFYYERIMFAEKEFLRSKFKDQFIEWAEKTPSVIPCFRNWKKPELGFSFKTVLRREFSTYFPL